MSGRLSPGQDYAFKPPRQNKSESVPYPVEAFLRAAIIDNFSHGKRPVHCNSHAPRRRGMPSPEQEPGQPEEHRDRQIESARSRLVMTTDDQGRAIFGIVDLDRNRQLGAREVMRTVDRVMSWDGNGDGRVSPDEIPYHFQVTIARSGLPGLTGEGVGAPVLGFMFGTRDAGAAGGPDWFQKMDRNHDGDVSQREFLGPRDQFDRLDRDNDGAGLNLKKLERADESEK